MYAKRRASLLVIVPLLFVIMLFPGIALAEEVGLMAGGANMTTQAGNPYPGNMNSNCTFAAWQKAKDIMGIELPSWGNAYSWYSAASGAGYSVGTTPRANSIVCFKQAAWNGNYGHVAYVSGYNASTGQIYKMEGNYNGTYHEGWAPAWESGMYGYIYLENNDKAGPSCVDFRVCEIEDSKFTVVTNVTDSSGIKSVRYAVWTEANGQDDLVWYDAHDTDHNNNYWAHVPYSNHKNEKGTYIVHLYAYDNAGNLTNLGISYRFDAGNPKVEGFHAWELKDSRFTVSAAVTSPNGIGSVRYAVWTEYNGQDDLVWRDAVYEPTGKFYYVYIPFEEHNNERGNYVIHLYAYDKGGKLTTAGISYVASAAVPSTTVEEGTYTFRSKLDPSMCLDVAGHSMDNQANVWLWKWNSEQESGPTCEKFRVKDAGDGSYYIIATHSDKAVEVYGAYGASGSNISQFTQNQTDAQRWYFVKNGDGTYTMRNKATGHVMDVENWKTASGTNVSQYPYHSENSSNQEFYLVPTDASKWSVGLSATSMAYTGSALKPTVTVSAGGVEMKEGVDYTVGYKDNVNTGTATVTVSGKGGFTGSRSTTFEIKAASQPSGGSQSGSSSGGNSPAGGSKSSDGSPSGGSPAPAIQFSDVPPTHWVASEGWLGYVTGKGLMSGYAGTAKFGPDDPLTRGQVATILFRYANPDSKATTDASAYAANETRFRDNASGKYYTAAMNWAYGQGIFTGDASSGYTTVRPDDGITRQELGTVLYRFAASRGASKEGASAASYAAAPDAGRVAGWASEGMGWCYAKRVLTGNASTGALDPQGGASRAHMAKMITVVTRDVLG